MYISNKEIGVLNDTINTCTKLNDDILENVSGGFTFKGKHIASAAKIGAAVGAGIGAIVTIVCIFMPRKSD